MVRSFINPALGPPVPKEERLGDAWLIIKEVLIGVLPLAALIGFTLGTILGGLATPTERPHAAHSARRYWRCSIAASP